MAAAGAPPEEKMVFEPIVEEGVFRFDCSPEDRTKAFPSVSFADPKKREDLIMTYKVPEFVPEFELRDGRQIVTIKLPPGTSFYGTGEASGQLERTGKRIFTWNTDAWGYSAETTSSVFEMSDSHVVSGCVLESRMSEVGGHVGDMLNVG